MAYARSVVCRINWHWDGGVTDPPEFIKTQCEETALKAYNVWAENSDSAVKAANEFCKREYGTTDSSDPRVLQKHYEIWNDEVHRIFSSMNPEVIEFFIEPEELGFVTKFHFLQPYWHNTLSFTLIIDDKPGDYTPRVADKTNEEIKYLQRFTADIQRRWDS